VTALFIDNVHVAAVPVQPPPHPTNRVPSNTLAVSVTFAFFANDAAQLDEQSMPSGLLETEPLPEPETNTVNGKSTAAAGATDTAKSDVTVATATNTNRHPVRNDRAETDMSRRDPRVTSDLPTIDPRSTRLARRDRPESLLELTGMPMSDSAPSTRRSWTLRGDAG
jgi:hypothetical protein